MYRSKHIQGYLNAIAAASTNVNANPNALGILSTILAKLQSCSRTVMHSLTMLRQLTKAPDAFYTWTLAKLLK